MINSINSGVPSQMHHSEQSLTQDHQNTITEILSQFDPEQLTESDALSIVESLSNVGIQPGKALESAFEELGFDAKSIGELAGVNKTEKGNRPPPPPMQSNDEISELVDYLTLLLEEKLIENNNSQLSDEERQYIYAQVNEKFGTKSDDSIINTTA